MTCAGGQQFGDELGATAHLPHVAGFLADYRSVKLHTLAANGATPEQLLDLASLVTQDTCRERRVCPLCTLRCTCSGSTSCTCQCNAACPEAPSQLSSDGQRYPIEPKVVPLVFGLHELRLCTPYWSCEGHLRTDGEIFRLPQVWFYSRSLIYPRLISDWLALLRGAHRLENPWHIAVSYSESGLDTGFSIEPDVKLIPTVDLASLQRDLTVLAEGLVPEVRALAREYITRFGATAERRVRLDRPNAGRGRGSPRAPSAGSSPPVPDRPRRGARDSAPRSARSPRSR